MSGVPPDVRTAQTQAAQTLGRYGPPNVATVVPSAVQAERVYAGLVTRALAFALDAAIVNGAAAIVGVVVGLGLSILHLPEEADIVVAAVLGALWLLWTVGYFTFFWSTTGQTPGDRVMRIRVVDGRDRGSLRPLRALVRFGWVIVAAIPLLAGFLIMLWDDRRRCLQDRLARTVVIEAPAEARPGSLRR
ncbi:MAG TPA: RDD family protein [Solirubrobacteraceae bacterium]|jgi:uncharacterized RDD family membrane protein YckC|nr:RDD family protein [Solirubrobacteraceae bacterium]